MRVDLQKFFWLSALVFSACNESRFQGPPKGAQKPPPVPENVTLSISCSDSDSTIRKTITSRQAYVQIEGSVCLEAMAPVQSESTILFVLDASGSMHSNDAPNASRTTCGRHQAALAIIEQLDDQDADFDKVRMGVISFSERSEVRLDIQRLSQLKSTIKNRPDLFCLYDGTTNYEAAFDLAEKTLARVEGPKTVYFISDGMPTVSYAGTYLDNDTDVYKDGLKAAERLRALDDVDLNSIYIEAQDGAEDDQQLAAAEDFLIQITGSSKKVRLVKHADDLADEILKFEKPQDIAVRNGDMELSFVNPGKQQTPITLRSLNGPTNGSPRLDFQTEPFLITIEEGRDEVAAELSIRVQGQGVESYSQRTPLRISLSP